MSIAPVTADEDGVIRTVNARYGPRLRVRVENHGDLAAEDVALRVYVPDRHRPLGWSDGEGKQLPGAPQPGMSVVLVDEDGRRWLGRGLLQSIGHIARGGHHDEFFRFGLELDIGEVRVPVRAVAHADAMGKEGGLATTDYSLRVERLSA